MADPVTFDTVVSAHWEPGATVVLSCQHHLTEQEVDELYATWRHRYPSVHLLILDGGLGLDGVVQGLPTPAGN